MYHLKANGILFSRQSLESKVIPKHKDKDTRIDGFAALCVGLRVCVCLCVFKLQPAIFPLSKHFIRFHELPAEQCNESNNRLFMVDWSLSGIRTSNLVIRESESPRPAASSILISRMTNSSVIIPN